jgi:hypothetical protein
MAIKISKNKAKIQITKTWWYSWHLQDMNPSMFVEGFETMRKGLLVLLLYFSR